MSEQQEPGVRDISARDRTVYTAGLVAGTVISPVWWVVDTLGITMSLLGKGFTAVGNTARGVVEEKAPEAARQEATNVKPAAKPRGRPRKTAAQAASATAAA